MEKSFNLLSTVEQGGCSAKLPATELSKVLSVLPKISNENLLVDIETHDDAGVYKINNELALVQTTDFFPPVCADAYDFGQIAAANAISDVYAMGGSVLTALNIILFPAKFPLEVLKEILRGGQDKLMEAGGVLMGGHTIDDDIPKYGMAVTGSIHPENITTNANAKAGEVLILSKPIGTGIAISAHKLELVKEITYEQAISSMKQLNRKAAEIMNKYDIRCATDVTGFGLAGHALKLAQASHVSVHLDTKAFPLFDHIYELAELGCLPGAAFTNMEFVSPHCHFDDQLDYNLKMIAMDAQTSGGLLMSCPPEKVGQILEELYNSGHEKAAIVGKVETLESKFLVIE